MKAIATLFGRSPIAPLQAHMNKVSECVIKVPELFILLEAGDIKGLETLAAEISKLEHAADLTKNDIRNNLPTGLFLAMDKGNLLEILSLQDSIADKAEDIGMLLTMRTVKMPDSIKNYFQVFLDKNLEAFEGARNVIDQLDELLEYSFGGNEAIKVNEMIDDVAFKEHEADKLQHTLLKTLFNMDDGMPYQDFSLWQRIIEEVSALSNLSENLGLRVRTMLDLK